jgi:hypothetical protein
MGMLLQIWKKTIDIPSNVSTIYKNEWKNWADFLGKE